MRLPLGEHPSFDRPPMTTRLWRYTDLSKFVDLLSSSKLWLTNAEILAADDPYEGTPGAIHFPHRMWRTLDEVPEQLRVQILELCSRGTDGTPQSAFSGWFMMEEQRCIMMQSGRRDYYINCWHAADHESAAMWKIYGSPGAGVAIVTNGARLEIALSENTEDVYLGAVRYRDPSFVQIGGSNAFDTIMLKRSSYSYEQEVRLVHWHTDDVHDALANFSWNDETLRFDDILDDPRPLRSGMPFNCDLDVLIERVVVSPFAPPWYGPMIERMRERFGHRFPVHRSKLLDAPLSLC